MAEKYLFELLVNYVVKTTKGKFARERRERVLTYARQMGLPAHEMKTYRRFVKANLKPRPNLIHTYPIWLTRDLTVAKTWLRSVGRGSERYGLVASSGAHRLRPDGIHIKAAIDPANWFLNDRSDVRSAFYLEEVATEFDVQGLELDWAGVCWDANLRFGSRGWDCHAFRGTSWQSVNVAERRSYLINSYRVLLTRARQGMVIYVPPGDDSDPTRPRHMYDGTYAFLK